nr:HTH domain-containing protein [Xanthomonadales bacterium]
MDRYERILTLHRILKSSRYPVPFDRLKDELRCSRATLYRDIAFLRDALGAPIDTDADNHAFGYAKDEAERFELPGLWLSSEELAALLALHQMLARTGPGVLSNALAPLRTRIERLLSNQESGKQYELGRIRVTGAATRRIDEAVFRAVASAVLERRQFAFRY